MGTASAPSAHQHPAQPDPLEWLVGSFDDDRGVNQRLDWAAKHCILVSPATTCRLPPGCSVAFSLVKIDPSTETHDVGFGKRSLLRTALLKLANAAGISWDNERSGRVDPGSHPHYVHWHASGAWRSLDGTVLSVPGDLQMDLRDGSNQCAKILESSRDAEKGRVQLRDTRAKILEHAQSKAELRAIRKALAIRAYTAEELTAKPFVIARLVFDGRDDDPEIERENKRAVRSMMLGGSRALFGAPPEAQRPALPAPARAYALLPPVGGVPDEDSSPDLVVGEPVVRANGYAPATDTSRASAPEAPVEPTPPPAPEPTPAATPTTPLAPRSAVSGVMIPGGKEKGTPIEAASDETLEYWANRIRRDLPGKDARFRDEDARKLAAMDAEIARRRGASGDDPMPKGW